MIDLLAPVRLAGAAYGALEQAVALVPRAAELVTRIEAVVTRADATVDTVRATDAAAAAVVARSDREVAAAAVLLLRTDELVGRAEALLARTTPLLDRALPLADRLLDLAAAVEPALARLAETTSPTEVEAVVRLVDTLPGLVDDLERDILPVVHTLGTVAPDLRDLLDTSRELNALLGSLPGFGRIRRRVEEQQEHEDAGYRAGAEPPAGPAPADPARGAADHR